MKKFIAAFGVATLGLMGGTAAAQYDGEGDAAIIAPDTVVVTASFTAAIEGCQVGETASFAIEGGDSDSASCTAGPATAAGSARGFAPTVAPTAGRAAVVLTAPSAPGVYDLTVTGDVSGLFGTVTINVVAATDTPAPVSPGTGGGGTLPDTGSSSGTVLQISIAALLVGALLVGIAWRRRRLTLA